ncbi:MAG: VWA domain-containing protein [Gemmatimonadota bacterium]
MRVAPVAGPDRAAPLSARLAAFCDVLRSSDVPVSMREELDGAAALDALDVTIREDVRIGLRIAMRVPRVRWARYNLEFERFWESRRGPGRPRGLTTRAAARPPAARGGGMRLDPDSPVDARPWVEAAGAPAYSPDALLRKKPFDRWSEAELRRMTRIMERLARRLASRRSRRLVPTRSRGSADLRASLRRAIGTEGEVLRLARRARARDAPEIVALCDTSGSMDAYSRFLLTFTLALRAAGSRCEVYAFNTSLVRLTPWLKPADVAATLERLSLEVPDWSGGTRIGDALAEFADAHPLRPTTVVVILSDGLDRGEPERLAAAMRIIARRTRRVIWLNPLMGDARYEPLARGMRAALPYVDDLAPAHDLESLERFVAALPSS